MPPHHPAGPPHAEGEEAARFLAAAPAVEQVQLLLTDICGVARGKVIRRADLAAVYTHGRPLPGSILALDTTGADVAEAGLLWADGDGDRLIWPLPGTLVPAPWLATPSALALVTMHETDGRPASADPRHGLVRAVERLAALGLTPVAAVELEFYLVDRSRGEDGRLRPPRGLLSGERPRHLQACSLDELEDFAPFFDDLYRAAAAMDLPTETLISEYAPGQMEIVLRHRADALRAADEAILYKRLVKGMALKHGFEATFMAKPYSGLSGSGMHLHVSLADAEGANVFAGERAEAPLLRHAVAGLLETLPEAMAILAPTANAYRRFYAGSYAPTKATWGHDNRSVAVRVTGGAPAARHIEHRVAGADANPYLALAAVLAGIHHGIAGKLEPPAPVAGNGYLAEAPALPTRWASALDLAATSGVLADTLGPELLRTFCTIKQTELERFEAEVGETDYAWYLRNV